MKSYRESMKAHRREYLIGLLAYAKGNVVHAAAVAKVHRGHLYALLHKSNLAPDGFRPEVDKPSEVNGTAQVFALASNGTDNK